MSQDFKLMFAENKDSTQSASAIDNLKADAYQQAGYARHLAFVLPNGKMEFFSYSYLVHCCYDPEQRSIFLEFSSHTVELKGYRLETLAYALMAQLPRIIRCVDKRYNDMIEEDGAVVNEITVKEKT